MRTTPFWLDKRINFLLPIVAGMMLVSGCVSAWNAEKTEKILSEAGFKQVVASSERQIKHIHTLPVDKITVVKLKGRTYYVFPDPAQNQIYLGNPEEYQAYQQLLGYQKIEAQNRVMAELGEDDGDDDANWIDWSSNAGWQYGSD